MHCDLDTDGLADTAGSSIASRAVFCANSARTLSLFIMAAHKCGELRRGESNDAGLIWPCAVGN